MKRYLAIFFLVILSLPAIYKVGLFSFYQLNRDFIAENYCVNKDQPITMCYGKCFLERGIQLIDATPNSDSLTAQIKLGMPEFIVSDFEFISIPSEKILAFSISPTPTISEGVFSLPLRPPLV